MKPTARNLGIFIMFVYMVSYLTRINFGAVIVEMVTATGFSKTELSYSVTGSFITYGVGQIISGFFGDIIPPKKLVFAGFVATTAMNIIIPFCASPYLMLVFWSINGFAQAFMWPPIVKILVSLLSGDEYKRATVTALYGSSLGTIVIYLVSPVLIGIWSWKLVFFFSALCGLIVMPIWLKLCPEIPNQLKPKNCESTDKNGVFKFLFTPMMISIMLAIILQGSLRDGITTWMPTYISETYSLGNGISILTGVALPVFGIICSRFIEYVYEKHIKNPLTCAGLIFAMGTASALLLLFFTGKNASSSIFLTSLLTGCMHGVNLILICMLPAYFKDTGHVSLVSGVLNACTYIGSAISTYGIALLTDNYGWTTTILIWFIFAAVGTALCFLCVPPWKKKFNSN